VKKFLKKLLGKETPAPQQFEGSTNYWESRYAKGGNSGAGSYDQLAEFKAEVVNKFVADNWIESVIEFGSGDGNQLKISEYPSYIGLDVSQTAIDNCNELFEDDDTKQFLIYSSLIPFFDNKDVKQCDLSMSLDVLYHLIEDDVYIPYLKHVFEASNKFVIIYSCNYAEEGASLNAHVRYREFTKDVEQHITGWEMVEKIDNKYPVSQFGAENGSIADFYIYRKTNA
jgi:hypothetical protein